jgi:hypothetical protein
MECSYTLDPETFPRILIKPECTYINDEKLQPQAILVTLPTGQTVMLETLVEAYLEHLKQTEPRRPGPVDEPATKIDDNPDEYIDIPAYLRRQAE